MRCRLKDCGFRSRVALAGALVCAALAFVSTTAASQAAEQKVVIPFDFVSKFDNGRYGRMVGEMLWKKLQRDGRFVVPESMLDVRQFCERRHVQPRPDTPLEQMRKIVRDEFDAQIAIWGSVERAPDAEAEVYDVAFKCVDFSADPPRILYDVQGRTKSVSEIPHLYVKNLLAALGGRTPAAPDANAPTADENWGKNPNLVTGGDFETGGNSVPRGWEKVAGQLREPLGNLVRWTDENNYTPNKVIRFTFDKTVAENEGVMYYSDFFPIEENARYRFQCRWRSTGPAVKVFIKCYDDVPAATAGKSSSRTRTDSAVLVRPPKGNTSANRREVYRSQQNLSVPAGESAQAWHTHTEDFTPKHTQYSPKWGRVMLYAYLKPGVVDFDDVVVKHILPAPSRNAPAKIRRPSRETQVTTEEMEANRRRSGHPQP